MGCVVKLFEILLILYFVVLLVREHGVFKALFQLILGQHRCRCGKELLEGVTRARGKGFHDQDGHLCNDDIVASFLWHSSGFIWAVPTGIFRFRRLLTQRHAC